MIAYQGINIGFTQNQRNQYLAVFRAATAGNVMSVWLTKSSIDEVNVKIIAKNSIYPCYFLI